MSVTRRRGWTHSLVLFALLPLILAVAGCGISSTTSNKLPATAMSIAISPSQASFAAGTTQQFTATATYIDGSTADVTAKATWAVTNSAVATINPAGLATGLTTGATSVTAAMNGVNSTAAATITAKVPTALAVSPATASLASGVTQQFTATATFSDGSAADVTASVAWSVGNPAVATVNPAGLVTGLAAGSTTVTAALGGSIRGTANFAVTAKAPTAIAISPNMASIAAGTTQQFTAMATYTDGSTTDVTAAAAWSTGNAAIATINPAGLATGIATGLTNITASLGGWTSTAPLTVTVKVPTSIAISPGTGSVAAGNTQQFTATATYSDHSTADVTAKASWTVSNAGVASISPAGVATGVSVGSTTVSASLGGGISSTAALTVTAKVPTAIAISPGTASFAVTTTQQFTAMATYSDGSTGDVTATATWSAANAAIATISPAGLATAVAAGTTNVSASLGSVNSTASLTVTARVPSAIAISPTPASFAAGTTQQFTATATYSDGTNADVTAKVNWLIANTAIATISPTGLATAVATGSTTVSASLASVSSTVPLVVTTPASGGANVTTWHFDAQRSGLNAGEQSLSPSNVNAQSFGKLFSYLVDGYVYAEPLLVSHLTVNGASHNVLYVATENDSVYAFDADNFGSGAPLWHTSLLRSGEAPMTTGPIQPYEGVTSTPVIDLASQTIYVVSAQIASGGPATFRLNALDITTGAQKFGAPVTLQASVPGTNSSSVNGVVTLNNSCIQRAALLLANGNIYMGFGSCHSGWLLAYNAHTLSQVGVFNSSPNLDGEGEYASAGGIWMGSGGPVADSSGNIYVVTGNGPWDGATAWSDSILKFSPALKLLDYFTPNDFQYMDCQDADLAAGGLLMIPGTTQLLGGGKTGKMYLVDSTNLGHEQPNDTGATQTLFFEPDLSPPYSNSCTDTSGTHTTMVNAYEIFGTAAYFNGSVYLGITPTSTTTPAGVRQFTYSGKLTPGSYTNLSIQQNTRGTSPFISSNGTQNGILWMIDPGQPLQSPLNPTNATLHAFDATDLTRELYNSNTNTTDIPGYGIKFTSPVVANGKVYISTGHDLVKTPNPQGQIDVYGLK